MDLNHIANHLQKFTQNRDWDQYHSPKNLAISLAVEAGELLEIFQWLPENSGYDETIHKKASEEIADILIYAIMFSRKMGIDIEKAVGRCPLDARGAVRAPGHKGHADICSPVG
jgi:dCTP diphosphatase